MSLFTTKNDRKLAIYELMYNLHSGNHGRSVDQITTHLKKLGKDADYLKDKIADLAVAEVATLTQIGDMSDTRLHRDIACHVGIALTYSSNTNSETSDLLRIAERNPEHAFTICDSIIDYHLYRNTKDIPEAYNRPIHDESLADIYNVLMDLLQKKPSPYSHDKVIDFLRLSRDARNSRSDQTPEGEARMTYLESIIAFEAAQQAYKPEHVSTLLAITLQNPAFAEENALSIGWRAINFVQRDSEHQFTSKLLGIVNQCLDLADEPQRNNLIVVIQDSTKGMKTLPHDLIPILERITPPESPCAADVATRLLTHAEQQAITHKPEEAEFALNALTTVVGHDIDFGVQANTLFFSPPQQNGQRIFTFVGSEGLDYSMKISPEIISFAKLQTMFNTMSKQTKELGTKAMSLPEAFATVLHSKEPDNRVATALLKRTQVATQPE